MIPPLIRPPKDDPAFLAGRSAVYALCFFVAAMQTGFGPFISVWLVARGWSLTEVGIALSVGTIAALCAQLPGGALVDALDRKRDVTALGLVVIASSALVVACVPSIPAIWSAQVLHAVGSAVTTPAIAALTLALSGHESFSDRLGGNARYAALGTAIAAATFGLSSSRLGEQSIFFITAALVVPATICLFIAARGVPPTPRRDHLAAVPRRERPTKSWTIFRDPIMLLFAGCVMLFQLGNAGLLSLAVGGLSQHGEANGFVVPAAIVVPQLIAALASPWAGAMARQLGRRRVLLVGFLALPARALLFALNPGAVAVDVIQMLDGISATVVGLMLPLIAADLTRKSGHLNLAIGAFGLASGLGATFSTTLAGWVADRMGAEVAFLGLASVGAIATILLAVAMPETQPKAEAAEVVAEAKVAAETAA